MRGRKVGHAVRRHALQRLEQAGKRHERERQGREEGLADFGGPLPRQRHEWSSRTQRWRALCRRRERGDRWRVFTSHRCCQVAAKRGFRGSAQAWGNVRENPKELVRKELPALLGAPTLASPQSVTTPYDDSASDMVSMLLLRNMSR